MRGDHFQPFIFTIAEIRQIVHSELQKNGHPFCIQFVVFYIFLIYFSQVRKTLNPLNGDVSDSQLNAGSKWPRLKIYLNVFRFTRNLVWLFIIAICTNMQKIRPISQKFTEILRFENFEITRFCFTLTYKNCRNSLNFWDTKVKFWI